MEALVGTIAVITIILIALGLMISNFREAVDWVDRKLEAEEENRKLDDKPDEPDP